MLLPVLQKFDLPSDRRRPVIDMLGVRLKVHRKFRRDSSELLGMMFELICILAEYFDDRFQLFFHNRRSEETTPAAKICAAGWYGCTGLVLPAFNGRTTVTLGSGSESRFRGWLMYVDLLSA
jgi:hypothetical protein